MAVGGHYDPPVLILAARIIDEKRFCVMEEENSAQHIFPALVPDEFRMASRIPYCNTEMMVPPTDIVGNPRLCSGKHKYPRFPVATDFVSDKCQPRLRPINHHTGENTLRGTALRHSTRGIEQVHRGVLVTSDVSKRDAGDATTWDLLEIERAPTPGKNLHLVSTGSNQMNRSPRDKDFVFIDPGANKHLILLSSVEKCRTGSWIGVGVIRIDDQSLSAEWIQRRLSLHV